MESHNIHLAPSITLNNLVPAPANVVVLWGLLGPGCLTASIKSNQKQWNRFSPHGLRTSQIPLCSWGFVLPIKAPPGMELWSCSLFTSLFTVPLFTVLMEFKPSPFSLFSLVPVAVSNFPLSLQLFLAGSAFTVFSPLSPSSLHMQKQFCALRGLSLPKFSSPCRIPAEFCGLGCTYCCVNLQISFLGVQDGLVLVWLCFMDARHTKNFHAVPSSWLLSTPNS